MLQPLEGFNRTDYSARARQWLAKRRAHPRSSSEIFSMISRFLPQAQCGQYTVGEDCGDVGIVMLRFDPEIGG
jgi:hypothetical protein